MISLPRSTSSIGIQLVICLLFLVAQGCKEDNRTGVPLDTSNTDKFHFRETYSEISKTVVAGQVTGFDIGEDLSMVKLIVNDPFAPDQIVENYYLEEDGLFHFEIDRLYPQEFFIAYGDLLQIYAFPGDSLYVSINSDINESIEFSRGGAYDYLDVNCANQEFQDLFLDFCQAYADDLSDIQEDHDAIKNMDYIEYTSYIDNRTGRYNAYLSQFLSKHNATEQFESYGRTWLQSKAWQDLMRYNWMHPAINELDPLGFKLPKEYFEFLEDEGWNEETYMITTQYFHFIHEYHMYLSRYRMHPDTSKSVMKFWAEGKKRESTELRNRFFERQTSGFAKKVILTKQFYQLINWKELDLCDEVYDKNIIGRPEFDKILTNAYAALRAHIVSPDYAEDLQLPQKDSSDTGLVFSSLATKYTDKVIYVDFWAPWCGPCMAEMPYSKNMQTSFADKDVVFVFLAVSCTEESWKATISEKKLTGEHYLLTAEEFEGLSSKFKISGIPRYMLINKAGEIVDANAPNPSSSNTLSDILTSLLDE